MVDLVKKSWMFNDVLSIKYSTYLKYTIEELVDVVAATW